jgi:hypothetical protein
LIQILLRSHPQKHRCKSFVHFPVRPAVGTVANKHLATFLRSKTVVPPTTRERSGSRPWLS